VNIKLLKNITIKQLNSIKFIKNSISKNRMYTMKKISSIILALFITLTFSNSAIARHSEEAGNMWDWKDLWTNAPMYRCNITYVKRYADYSTKDKYLTTQHRVRGDRCDWGARHLAKKILKWMKKDTTNEVIDFSVDLACKKRTDFKWDHYDKCDKTDADTDYRLQMIRILFRKLPEQTLVH
jgi:hypothetical protein